MHAFRWSFLPLVLVVACGGADPDGDGLVNSEEADLGSDPKVVDSDGDGLDDGAEKDAGSDPTSADSDGDGLGDKGEVDLGLDPRNPDQDGDGMTDGDEVKYGFDPFDDKSDGYKGGWPMQEVSVKDGIEDQGGKPGSIIEVGKRFKRLRLKDQYGDEVDLYDFAGQGKKVVVDTSAQWCPPCQFISAAVSGQYSEDDLVGGGLTAAESAKIVALSDAVLAGEVLWVSIIAQDNAGNGATRETAKKWDEEYGNPAVPVLVDTDQTMVPYMIAASNGWPTVALMNESMTIVWDSSDDPTPYHYLIEIHDRTVGQE